MAPPNSLGSSQSVEIGLSARNAQNAGSDSPSGGAAPKPPAFSALRSSMKCRTGPSLCYGWICSAPSCEDPGILRAIASVAACRPCHAAGRKCQMPGFQGAEPSLFYTSLGCWECLKVLTQMNCVSAVRTPIPVLNCEFLEHADAITEDSQSPFSQPETKLRIGCSRNSVAACSRRVRTAPLSSLTGLAFVLGPGSPAINRWAILYRPPGLNCACTGR